MIRTLLRLAAVGACAFALSGCITLLPKSKPVQLYSFGTTAAPAPAPAASVGVYRASGIFQAESAGDRILTLSGGKAAYIAQARWVSPASVLFDQAVLAAFDAAPGPVRLISRGEPGKADYALRIDVRNFETLYDPDARAPTIFVRLRVALAKADHSSESVTVLESRVKARNNRVSAIVTAYDAALADVLKQLVAWANQNAPAVPT